MKDMIETTDHDFKVVNASSILAIFVIIALVEKSASLPFILVGGFDPLTPAQFAILLGAGCGAAVGQFGITAAYRFAPPSEIAVFDYTNVIFTSLFGFALFAQVPDLWSVLGFALIVCAGVRSRKRRSA